MSIDWFMIILAIMKVKSRPDARTYFFVRYKKVACMKYCFQFIVFDVRDITTRPILFFYFCSYFSIN